MSAESNTRVWLNMNAHEALFIKLRASRVCFFTSAYMNMHVIGVLKGPYVSPSIF